MSELTRREFLQASTAGGAALLAQGVPLPAQEAKDKLPQRVLGKTGVRVPFLRNGAATVRSDNDSYASKKPCAPLPRAWTMRSGMRS